jgi:hypothetical protein
MEMEMEMEIPEREEKRIISIHRGVQLYSYRSAEVDIRAYSKLDARYTQCIPKHRGRFPIEPGCRNMGMGSTVSDERYKTNCN